MKRNKKTKRWKRAVLCMITALAAAGTIPAGNGIVSAQWSEEPAETADFPGSIRDESLEQQIGMYLEAVAEGDADRARALRGMENKVTQTQEAVCFRHGLRGFDDVKTVIYPLGEDRLVFVSYDMVIDGLEPALPGLVTWLAEQDGQGGWILLTDNASPSKEQQAQIRARLETDEIGGWFDEINESFMEIVWADADVYAWLQAVSDDSKSDEINQTGYRKETP
ncbi:hypothetical protein V1224_08405 [Lachnospiraceae bacterium JLR.KK008]